PFRLPPLLCHPPAISPTSPLSLHDALPICSIISFCFSSSRSSLTISSCRASSVIDPPPIVFSFFISPNALRSRFGFQCFYSIFRHSTTPESAGRCSTLQQALSIFHKIIHINLLDNISFLFSHSDIIIQHQLRQLFPVNQDDLSVDSFHVLLRSVSKSVSGDEYAFIGAMSDKASGKFLNFMSPYRSIPPFSLNVNGVKSQFVLLNNSVNSSISATSDCLPSISS